jgi:ribonucleoside-triphosphate reductase
MWQMGKKAKDGKPYIDLNKATYIIGIIGLDECLRHLVGKELHQDEETFKLGLRIISYMHFRAKEYEEKYKLRVALEESPAESATRRLAKVDMREFPEAMNVIKGDIDNDEYYYTNSIHFRANADISLVERIQNTICEDCHKASRGIKEECDYCQSPNVYGVTRIVGYFSRVSNWNKSKLGELKDRQRGNYGVRS